MFLCSTKQNKNLCLFVNFRLIRKDGGFEEALMALSCCLPPSADSDQLSPVSLSACPRFLSDCHQLLVPFPSFRLLVSHWLTSHEFGFYFSIWGYLDLERLTGF